MSENISDRNEYSNSKYAKMRTAQIEAILENENLESDEIAQYEAELADLAPYLVEATEFTAKFRLVAEKQFKSQLQTESTLHPNQPIYGLVKGHSYAITLDYPTVNYLIGMGYSLCYEYEYHPKHSPNMSDSESNAPDIATLLSATKSLLESFIDNYTTDGLNRGLNIETINAEIAQVLSGIFKPGNLTHLGYTAYELTDNGNTTHQTGIRKLIVFKSETDDCIDMVLDVQNWNENFQHEVDIAVHKWRNSDDEYTIVITEHLESVGYIFTLRDDCDIYSDYS